MFDKVINIYKIVTKKFKDDHVNEYAAECAYFTILSFVPFMMLFLTLVQYTPIDKGSITSFIDQIVPTGAVYFINGIIDEVYAKSMGTVSLAALFALWSASRGFYYLSKGLRKIYNTEHKVRFTPFIRFEGIIYTIGLSAALILYFILLLLGKMIHKFVLNYFEPLGVVTGLLIRLRPLILILMMFSISLLIYKFIPKHKQKVKTQIIGAVACAIGWYITSWIFSKYMDLFGFKNTYGSLTTIVLLMMWVYFCMYIILASAEVNVMLNKYLKREHKKFTKDLK